MNKNDKLQWYKQINSNGNKNVNKNTIHQRMFMALKVMGLIAIALLDI